ncbi:MAG TPA: adenylate/guanylate cyclase domain-containing protein [Methylomirabilota bacterium]|nr:adenylate/guanylate cyclase domain-containing protein [Methylomirabilota bacterium]
MNIWYNATQIDPLLTPAQQARFMRTVLVFNGLIYPPLTAIWIAILLSLREPLRRLTAGQPVDPGRLERARRRVINLPWWAVVLPGLGWVLCIPVFLEALVRTPDSLDARLYVHLPVSFAISAMISITHGFFIIELLSQRLLYRVFFRDARPWAVRGALALSLRARGVMWWLAAGVCPIGSLLLLTLVPENADMPAFARTVAVIGIALGFAVAWLISRLVTEPVEELRAAAQRVAAGELEVEVAGRRADEFGPLIDEFNHMVAGLREKVRVEENFGRHVGRAVARRILERDGLGGAEEEITVVFVDIRNFTARSAAAAPTRIVSLLNLFLTEMVEPIERHGGLVNKFLGDGLMAFFSEGTGRADHADAALAASREMLERLARLNERLGAGGEAPIAIGVGLHTGRAVVGSVGTPRRMEYTVIGDTVNVASRVESLTKVLGEPLLLTEATRAALRAPAALRALPPQEVRGQPAPIAVLTPVSSPR